MFAVAGAVLRWSSSSLDILGYASTLTRNNPYINVENVSSAMGGLERTKVLRDLVLRLEDVYPDKEQGLLVIASVADVDSRRSTRPQKGRLYL